MSSKKYKSKGTVWPLDFLIELHIVSEQLNSVSIYLAFLPGKPGGLAGFQERRGASGPLLNHGSLAGTEFRTSNVRNTASQPLVGGIITLCQSQAFSWLCFLLC